MVENGDQLQTFVFEKQMLDSIKKHDVRAAWYNRAWHGSIQHVERYQIAANDGSDRFVVFRVRLGKTT